MQKTIKMYLSSSSFIIKGEINHLVLNDVSFDFIHRLYPRLN